MITTVTLNPMLDKTIRVRALERGRIERASAMEMVAGGKGVNVSRQLHRLGIETTATGFLGGEVGKIVAGLIRSEGYNEEFVWTAGSTREGLTFLEEDGTSTSVFEPSSGIAVDEAAQLKQKVAGLRAKSSWVVCSGSSPARSADELFREIIRDIRPIGVSTVLDSYGPAFARALEAVPTMVKPNKPELEQSLKTSLSTEGEIRRALGTMLKSGVRYCVLTDGSHPVFAASDEGEWKLTPPALNAVNPTGSGDSMVAGILYGFMKNWNFERCLRFGAAAGAANAAVWAVAASSYDSIMKYEPTIQVQKLS